METFETKIISNVPIFRFKRGGHISVFYQDEATLLDFLVPYICEGLQAGEKCFLVQERSVARRLPAALEFAGVNFKEEVERQAIELHCTDEVYLKSDDFDVQAMIDRLEQTIEGAVSAGFKGLRTAGDLGWASAVNLPHDTLLHYEKMVQERFPNRPAVGVCQYPVSSFPEELLDQVLETHQASLQQPQAHSSHSSLSILRDDFMLDVVANRQQPHSKVYYIVQRFGSKNIVGFGAEATVESAIRMGQRVIQAS
jgi:hypothetical protein